MKNTRKNEDIKLVTTNKKNNYLVPEPDYRIRKKMSENLLAIEIKESKTKESMSKPVYLGLLILDIGKMVMFELWYDYTKPKYN